MAHGGPGQQGLWGLSLRGVLNTHKKNSSLKDPPAGICTMYYVLHITASPYAYSTALCSQIY